MTGAISSGWRKSALTAVGFALAAIPAFAVDQSLPGIELFRPASESDLDRVAFAVDGAESSHGTDLRMWRPELNGPQGPMIGSAGSYTDDLAKQDGRWLFRYRKIDRFIHDKA